ncbi:MAG: PqqD family protein [Caldilineaceae bacterium]|nr:PqqD family protein [Caldilineaceae bacterium]
MLTSSSIVSRADDVLAANVDNELVMIRLESDGYFGLDEIGRRIWELLDEARTVDAICSSLLEEYDVQPADCEADVLRFLSELEEHGVVFVEN